MKVDRFTKVVFVLNCLVPVALLAWDARGGKLGANPVNFAIHTTGILALIFLWATLAVTPIAAITRWFWLGQFRRLLGLCAFFHAVLHLAIFFGLDRAASVKDTVSEIIKRPFLMVGMFSLVLMVPLAATSANAMIRRIGPARWKALHRLVYLAAIAAAIHFYMQVKADTKRPLIFAAVLAVLLLYRVAAYLAKRRQAAVRSRSALAAATTTPIKQWTGRLKVARVIDETPDVRTFRLEPISQTGLPFTFLPGQYLNLVLEIDGQTVRRSYTIASSPKRTESCELSIKRESHGLASRHMHDHVRPGDELEVRAPAGKFTFTGAEASSIVLIAGGVGITPLMSKIRYLTDIAWQGEIFLIHSAKTQRDIIFRDELDELAATHPNLHVTITLTREPGPEGTSVRGRVDRELLERAVPEIAGQRVHICGPTEMIESVRKLLMELGVAETSIRTERFFSPGSAGGSNTVERSQPGRASESRVDGDGGASIAFARSLKSAPIAGEKTVLEAAESLGVRINYDCRSGICGECKVKLVSGNVVMDAEDALTPKDRADDFILSCQAHCLDEVVVEA